MQIQDLTLAGGFLGVLMMCPGGRARGGEGARCNPLSGGHGMREVPHRRRRGGRLAAMVFSGWASEPCGRRCRGVNCSQTEIGYRNRATHQFQTPTLNVEISPE